MVCVPCDDVGVSCEGAMSEKVYEEVVMSV